MSAIASHLFDFTHGWLYVFGIGVVGGTVLRQSPCSKREPSILVVTLMRPINVRFIDREIPTSSRRANLSRLPKNILDKSYFPGPECSATRASSC